MTAVARRLSLAMLVGGLALVFSGQNTLAADDDGFESIFDGKSLDGWDGNPKLWSVEDGAITGTTTAEDPIPANTFLIWRKGEVGNFELKLEYKIVGDNANSGIQYRSKEMTDDKWVIGGYQGDFHTGDTYSGINYDERGRGILAERGQKTRFDDNGKKEVIETFADTKDLQSKIKKEDWNEYHIIADGYTFTHKINGHTTSIVIDDDESDREAKGLLAFQVHKGPPMKVQFRNIRLKRLDGKKAEGAAKKQSRLEVRRDGSLVLNGARVKPENLADQLVAARRMTPDIVVTATPETQFDIVQGVMRQVKEAGLQQVSLNAGAPKKIVFIAGKRSHGYGAHEHKAGCMLLQKELEGSGLPIVTALVTEGWPEDESVLDDADAIVIYADGGGGHPAVAHLETLRNLANRGTGIVCLHYGVEVPKGEAGDAFLDSIGGYFEADWSVNPHWVADFDKLPQHPITRGVKPFKTNDEWYYHMRFREGMEGVTLILTDLPPSDTLSRPDGPHSGNPAVRKAISNGEPQHMAWAYERPDGGRGFGFTGAHFHWNWGNTEFRQLVQNAIVWSTGLEVPQDGVPVNELTVADLEANQDEEKPGNHNPARIQAMLDEWNR